ncbi:hypothetical protein WMY93_033014, partial [Mugilogobius chulae]
MCLKGLQAMLRSSRLEPANGRGCRYLNPVCGGGVQPNYTCVGDYCDCHCPSVPLLVLLQTVLPPSAWSSSLSLTQTDSSAVEIVFVLQKQKFPWWSHSPDGPELSHMSKREREREKREEGEGEGEREREEREREGEKEKREEGEREREERERGREREERGRRERGEREKRERREKEGGREEEIKREGGREEREKKREREREKREERERERKRRERKERERERREREGEKEKREEGEREERERREKEGGREEIKREGGREEREKREEEGERERERRERRETGSKTLAVPLDVYNELKSLPLDKAIDKLRALTSAQTKPQPVSDPGLTPDPEPVVNLSAAKARVRKRPGSSK